MLLILEFCLSQPTNQDAVFGNLVSQLGFNSVSVLPHFCVFVLFCVVVFLREFYFHVLYLLIACSRVYSFNTASVI